MEKRPRCFGTYNQHETNCLLCGRNDECRQTGVRFNFIKEAGYDPWANSHLFQAYDEALWEAQQKHPHPGDHEKRIRFIEKNLERAQRLHVRKLEKELQAAKATIQPGPNRFPFAYLRDTLPKKDVETLMMVRNQIKWKTSEELATLLKAKGIGTTETKVSPETGKTYRQSLALFAPDYQWAKACLGWSRSNAYSRLIRMEKLDIIRRWGELGKEGKVVYAAGRWYFPSHGVRIMQWFFRDDRKPNCRMDCYNCTDPCNWVLRFLNARFDVLSRF